MMGGERYHMGFDMDRTPRCLLPDVDTDRPAVDRAGVHHCEHVLRLSPGDAVELVDGRGGLARARWGAKGLLTDVSVLPRAAPPGDPFVLAVAPPRPSRLDWLVEKAAELGVSRLALLDTRHTARDVSPARLERLRRKTGEAMLQSRRLHRMQIDPPVTLATLLEGWPGDPLWLASLDAPKPADLAAPAAGGPLLGLVGPEGGWHDDELQLALRAGALAIGIGSGVLRVETAALALSVLAGLRRPAAGLRQPTDPPTPAQ